ncbi:MAG: ABC transporter ATP-binding protein [Candidatus Cryptobacteroides sp.]
MIELRNISLGYPGRTLLEDVSCRFENSSLTALIGRNGSGKSSLLRAIASLSDNYKGDVLIDGGNIKEMDATQRARSVSFVTTERVRIANLTCRDLVSLGRAPYTNWFGRMQEDDKDVVMASLEAVGMADYADRTLDRMSDGECQRVMIARALAQDTPNILLDEPTSFLDLPGRYEICSLLEDLAHRLGKCIVFSTHELEIAAGRCDGVAIVDSPSLIHLPADMIKASGHIRRLFGIDI